MFCIPIAVEEYDLRRKQREAEKLDEQQLCLIFGAVNSDVYGSAQNGNSNSNNNASIYL